MHSYLPVIHHMVFVENVQKISTVSSLKSFDSSFKFCCKGSTFTGKVVEMSICTSLILEDNRVITLSRHAKWGIVHFIASSG